VTLHPFEIGLTPIPLTLFKFFQDLYDKVLIIDWFTEARGPAVLAPVDVPDSYAVYCVLRVSVYGHLTVHGGDIYGAEDCG